jgi:hypothetical protein
MVPHLNAKTRSERARLALADAVDCSARVPSIRPSWADSAAPSAISAYGSAMKVAAVCLILIEVAVMAIGGLAAVAWACSDDALTVSWGLMDCSGLLVA